MNMDYATWKAYHLCPHQQQQLQHDLRPWRPDALLLVLNNSSAFIINSPSPLSLGCDCWGWMRHSQMTWSSWGLLQDNWWSRCRMESIDPKQSPAVGATPLHEAMSSKGVPICMAHSWNCTGEKPLVELNWHTCCRVLTGRLKKKQSIVCQWLLNIQATTGLYLRQ